MRKCISCSEETRISLTPDLDIKGIPVCKDCMDDVRISLLLVTMGDKTYEWFEKKYKIKES